MPVLTCHCSAENIATSNPKFGTSVAVVLDLLDAKKPCNTQRGMGNQFLLCWWVQRSCMLQSVIPKPLWGLSYIKIIGGNVQAELQR